MASYVTPEPVNMTASIPITLKSLYKYTLHTGKIVSYVISALVNKYGSPPDSEKNENFPDSKIFAAKTFRIKRVKRVNFQIRDKCA